MSTDRPAPQEWPARWELSAPESHVLSFNGSSFAIEPFKLAVKELVARAVLRAEMVERRLLRVRREPALYCGPRAGSPVAPSLAPVLGAFDSARRRAPGDGVLLPDLVAAARAESGRLQRYHERHVVPLLVTGGLLEHDGKRGVPARSTFRCTPAGRDADAELERWIALGRENLARWRADDPARAVAYAHGAGAAVLLAEDLHPELNALDRRGHGNDPHNDDPVSLGVAPRAFGDRTVTSGGRLDLDDIGLDLSGLGLLGDFGAGFGGLGGGDVDSGGPF